MKPPSKQPSKTPLKSAPKEAAPKTPPNPADKRISDLEIAFGEMKNRYLMAVADLENYKKRMTKEREEIMAYTSERLLKELLEVKDHLELALDHSKTATNVKPLHEGVNLTLKQMVQFLEKSGVSEVKALGEPFNPAFHEAMGQEENSDAKPGSVVREYQKGYLFNGRLLRASKVIVVKES